MAIAKLIFEDADHGSVNIRTEFEGERDEYSRGLELAILCARAMEDLKTINSLDVKKPRPHLPH